MNETIELRHLRYFLAVAEELNFGRAAARLMITQPSLSRQIQNLERELGVVLFERNQRQIQLTGPGQLFLAEVQQILARTEQGIRLVQRANQGEIGQLTVGFQGGVVYDIMPLSIRQFRERFPGVEVVLKPLDTSDQVEALKHNELHIGFIGLPITDRTLSVEPILQEPLLLALPDYHPLAAQAEIPITALADEPLIVASRDHGCGLYEKILDLYAQAGLRPNVIQAAKEMQVILGFVSAGIGISFLPTSVKQLNRAGVVYRTLSPQAPMFELAVAWKRERSEPVLQNFLAVIRELVTTI